MKTLNWIEKELARRYIIGALLHVNKDLHTDGWRDRGIIDASNIFINRLNELATVYELEPGENIGIDPVACRLCRRETQHPNIDICLRCTVSEVMTFMSEVHKEDRLNLVVPESLVDNLLDTQNSQDRDERDG